MAELNTIITLRQGTTEQWTAENSVRLADGEMGLEYCSDGSVKIKVGKDGKHWNELPYVGGDLKAANVFQVELTENDTDVIAIIEAKVNAEGAKKQNGDVAIAKTTFADGKYSYTSYVYDSELDVEGDASTYGWSAMDGNYSADNVFLKNKITLAGNYGGSNTNVGNKKIGDSFEAGTSIQSLLMDILSQRLQPSKTNPSATIIFTNKNSSGKDDEVEIGTTYTPMYKTTFSDGKFTYDEVTGCTSTEATVTFDGKTKTIAADALNGATGSMDSVVIDNTTKKKFTLTYGWTASTITPKDNLGDPATNGVTIDAASNQSATSSHGVTGFRYAFGGSNVAVVDANSVNIRALGSKTKSSNSTFDVDIDQDANFVMIAVPDGRKVTKVEDGNAFGTDIFSEFTQVSGTVSVGGADATAENIGSYAIAYNVYIYAPKASLSANTYTVHIANE